MNDNDDDIESTTATTTTSNWRKQSRDHSSNYQISSGIVVEGAEQVEGIIKSLILFGNQDTQQQDWGESVSGQTTEVSQSNHRKTTTKNSTPPRTMLDLEYNYSTLQANSYEACTTSNDNNNLPSSRKRPRPPPPPPTANPPPITFNFVKTENTKNPNTSSTSHQQRRLWVKSRSKAWWDEVNSPDYPSTSFHKSFRMSKSTFNKICTELNSVIAKEDTMLRAAIPVQQRVAVCIYRLATGEPLRSVSKRFGLGISTCHKLVLEVCKAIHTILMPKYLQWPEDFESITEIKQNFQSISNIPNLIGSIYTTHIPIIAPKISVTAYLNHRHTERNQKTSYSITVQGVVDHTGKFTDVCIGWPGSMPDEQILEKSHLYQRACQGLMEGIWVVGGSGYPLTDWLLVPYSQHNLTWTQHAFNERVIEVQGIAKEAFRRLKGRWGCLQKRTEVKLQELPVVLGACCVLHNICEMNGEEVMEIVKCDIFDDQMLPEIAVRSETSVKAREAIAHNLLHHGHAGTGFL